MSLLDTSLREVLNERVRQDEKWGEQNHGPQRWLTILVEEVGELAEAILDAGAHDDGRIRNELVQVAAVSLAWLECQVRNDSRVEAADRRTQ